MSQTKESSSSSTPAWPFLSPSQFMAQTMDAIRGAFAPSWLQQSILPGWTFGSVINVTERNSRAPDTERDVVAEHSYGQQLGRVIDALAAIIDERPKDASRDAALDKLIELKEEIQAIKFEAAARRTERIKSDIELLKAKKPEEYRQLVEAIRKGL